MSAAIRPRSHSVLLPVLLLLAGVLLLLFNLGALPEGAGWRLLLVSPFVLVMLGLQIVIGRLIGGSLGTAASLAAVGLVGLLGLTYVTLGPHVSAATRTISSSASLPAGTASGTLHIYAAATRVSIIFGETGDDLYRARLSYAGAPPKLNSENGELSLVSGNRVLLDWGLPADQYTLTLSRAVPWSIDISGAGTTTSVEVLGGRLQSFRLDGVGSDAQLSLGTPTGTVPIEVSGVAARLALRVPSGTQYRASATGLAASLSGTPESSGWALSADRYDVSALGIATHIEIVAR